MSWLEYEKGSWWRQLPIGLRAGWGLFWRLGGLIGLILFCAAGSYWFRASRFDLAEVEAMPERTILSDHKGRELGAVHGARRRIVSLEELPEFLVTALLTREDRSFFEHPGVDGRGVARAFLRNLVDGEMTQGASTLTMQLARNTYYLMAKSLDRKLLEIALSLRIEGHFSKEEILCAYLNRIYFGAGAFGIGQAAQTYFGKAAQDLTLAEAALLVGIIRAPHDFSPRLNPEAAIRERNDVLRAMMDLHRVGIAAGVEARHAELALTKPPVAHNDAIRCVRRHLNELLDERDFRVGGLDVTSTIDVDLQAFARDELSGLLAEVPDLEGALVVVDCRSGAVRSILTGRDANTSQFNRALDARRQLGSAFGPFIAGFAVERGRLPIANQPVVTGRQLPTGDIVRLSKRLGLKGPFGEKDDLARGNVEATPLELGQALAAIGGRGVKPRTYFVQSVARGGEELFQNELVSHEVLEPAAAAAVVEQKRVWLGFSAPRTDLWVLGVSQERAVAFWLGYDDSKKLPREGQLDEKGKGLVEGLLDF